MNITDEMLMAYADDELEPAERVAVEEAIARDPKLGERVARHQALRRTLQGSFAGVLSEAVPERLIKATQAVSTPVAPIDLAAARETRRAKGSRRWTLPEWSAIAASLLVGLLFGHLGIQSDTGTMVASRDGGLVAQGTLARTLTEQLASDSANSANVRVNLSFRDKSGSVCRSFLVSQVHSYAGLACNEGGDWRIPVLTEAEPASATAMQMAASSLPPAVLEAISARILGEPLDADGERAAKARNWK